MTRLTVVFTLIASGIAISGGNAQGRPPMAKAVPAIGGALFKPGEVLVGPSLLIGNVEGGSLGLGGEFEYGLTSNPSLGSGTIGLGVRLHTYQYSVSHPLYSASVRITPVAIGANYHFPIPESKIDPYAGLSIGYASASYSDTEGSNFTVNSGTYLMIDGGARYYFNPRAAIQAGLSVGSRADVGLLRLAVVFRL